MPSGVYKRTKQLTKKQLEGLKKGHEQEARKKAVATLKEIAKDPEWREMVSNNSPAAMHRPDVRERHLKGLENAGKKYGINWKGGNGQPPTEIIKIFWMILGPMNYVIEHAIPTESKINGFQNAPTVYKVDFAHIPTKTAIEIDGLYHTTKDQKTLDTKKDKILKALGWTVIRYDHGAI